ncbi:MAG TPA: DUF5107 domain-containing protein, partial [Candidatus Hydrogenedentes bacterium]|nr:DUF5107 domain-containing protein [Candidatus Hydrogenedentota bacterium]
LDRGLVSFANHHELKGKKAWTWGKDDFGVVSQMALSDAGPIHAQYIEVQSGPLLTQADYGLLEPRQAVEWREYWYPVHGLGDGFEFATRDAAVQTRRDGETLEVRAIATGAFPGATLELRQGAATLHAQPCDLSPAQPVIVGLPNPPEGAVRVLLTDAEGGVLLDYETPLDIPEVAPPDLTVTPARPDGAPTADEKYREARVLDSQLNYAGARSGYEAALGIDPLHVPSLIGLATLDLESGRFQDCEARARAAVSREPESGLAWFLLGAARLQSGDAREALACGYKAARCLDTVALGYELVGRARMIEGDYAGAVEAFARAVAERPGDPATWARLAAARHALGEEAPPEVADKLRGDPLDFILLAVNALGSDAAMDAFLERLRDSGGEKAFIAIDAVTFLAGMGLYGDAARLFRATMDGETPAAPASALSLYHLAYWTHKAGNEAEAARLLERAAALPSDFALPSGAETIAVFRYAVGARSDDANAHLLMGHLLAGLHRLDEAVPHWEQAVALDPALSVGWRLIGVYANKKQKDVARAETCFRRALEHRPDDQVLHLDLAEALAAQDRRLEGIHLIANMPRTRDPRYDAVLWLAEAYLAEDRFDDCIDLLSTARFSNWEGHSRPHDLFVAALLSRGKTAFAQDRYEDAIRDFETALTYPENIAVGARYVLTDAEVRYWLGKALAAIGRIDDARAAWEAGAGQRTSSDPPLPFITVTRTQDEYVKRCATALEVLAIRR